MQKQNEILHYRNNEIKNLFKTLKQDAINYKQKTKNKIIDMKKQMQSLQNKILNNESDTENLIQSKMLEESSANINEIMRMSREKESDYTSQIKNKSKQLDELKNQISHYKSL